MRHEEHKDVEQQENPQPKKGDRGGNIFGAENPEVERQNPDFLVPPSTDSGTMPNLKFSYAQTHMRVEHGGWSREVTMRELPPSKTIAGVNMHLEPGGVRELHWHKEAEWAYMISGKARITAIDTDGKQFVDDVEASDLWYFPPGIPHSIKGLNEGAEFLLAFDDGAFSENSTFSIADWFAHTPKNVLAKNFGVDESEFEDIPDGQLYMYQGDVPGPIVDDLPEQVNEFVDNPFSFKLLNEVEPIETSGGKVWIADSTNFPVSKTIALGLVELEPGGIREMHWHPNQDEWQYYLDGKGRMTVFGSEGKARTYDYRSGDVGYVPLAMGHYVENTGDQPLRFLEMFKSDHFADISLNQWMAQTPPGLLKEHFPFSEDFMKNALHSDKRANVKYKE